MQLDEVLHDTLVEVLTSQVGVSIGGQHLKHAIVDCQQGHIEGTTTQIKHQDVLFSLFLVQAIGNGSSSAGRITVEIC